MNPSRKLKDTTYTKVFVGNIPYSTNDETLKKYFAQFGTIEEAVVIRSKNDNASKGYGFVTMKDELGAQLACQNRKPLIDGRRANVQLAYLGAKKKTSRKVFSSMSMNETTITSEAYSVPPPPFVVPSSMVFPNGQPTYVVASSPTSTPPPVAMSPVFYTYGGVYDQNLVPAGQLILSSAGFPQTYVQPLPSPSSPPGTLPTLTMPWCQHAQYFIQPQEGTSF